MKLERMLFIFVTLILLAIIVIGGLSILSGLGRASDSLGKITCKLNQELARKLYYQDPEKYSDFDRNKNNKPCE